MDTASTRRRHPDPAFARAFHPIDVRARVAAFAQVLTHTGMLHTIPEQVRFARARFGHYELIDFVAVLIGYMLSGEPTLLAFYERLAPFAGPFMALFGRNRLPHRSTLSRFLAALNQNTVEALRTRFHEDVLARNPFPFSVHEREHESSMRDLIFSA